MTFEKLSLPFLMTCFLKKMNSNCFHFVQIKITVIKFYSLVINNFYFVHIGVFAGLGHNKDFTCQPACDIISFRNVLVNWQLFSKA